MAFSQKFVPAEISCYTVARVSQKRGFSRMAKNPHWMYIYSMCMQPSFLQHCGGGGEGSQHYITEPSGASGERWKRYVMITSQN